MKFGVKDGSAISGMALAANQFLAAAAKRPGALSQLQISMKNGPDGKIRLARAEARSLVVKRPFSYIATAMAAATAAAKVTMFKAGSFADQRRFSPPSRTGLFGYLEFSAATVHPTQH